MQERRKKKKKKTCCHLAKTVPPTSKGKEIKNQGNTGGRPRVLFIHHPRVRAQKTNKKHPQCKLQVPWHFKVEWRTKTVSGQNVTGTFHHWPNILIPEAHSHIPNGKNDLSGKNKRASSPVDVQKVNGDGREGTANPGLFICAELLGES